MKIQLMLFFFSVSITGVGKLWLSDQSPHYIHHYRHSFLETARIISCVLSMAVFTLL